MDLDIISLTDETHMYKVGYIIREFQFKHKNEFEKVAISVSKVQPGVWTEFNQSIFESLIEYREFKGLSGYRFIGPVYPKPLVPPVGKTYVAFLQTGLQYIIVNQDYLNGVYANGKIPQRIVANGKMAKMRVYLHVRRLTSGDLTYKLVPVPKDY